MKRLQSRLYQKWKQRRSHGRFIALVTAWSLLMVIIVPLMSVVPGFTVAAAAQEISRRPMRILAEGSGNPWFDDVQQTAMGDNLSGKIEAISITTGGRTYNGSPIVIDAGNADPLLFDINLSYKYDNAQLNASNILSSHCVYYQIPPNTVTVTQNYFGKSMQVIDSDWSNEVPSGYYSISESGLVVIRFTDDYLTYLEQSTNGFRGTIGFRAKAERADNADGDRNFTLEHTEIQIQFDDEKPSMTKDGSTGRDANGQYVQWSITIQNPNGHIDLSEYTLTDSITDQPDGQAAAPVNWADITDVVVTPEGAAEKSADGFSLSGHAQQVTITYKERAESGHHYSNTASLTKPGDEPITASKEVSIVNALEAGKSGTPDYQISGNGEGKKITWKIDVRNKSGDSLDQTKITDSMSFPSDTKVYYYDSAYQLVELPASFYSISGNELTLSGQNLPSSVQIVYDTELTGSFDANGTIQASNSCTVESTKTDNPPTPDNDNTATVTYTHQYRMEKSCSNFITESDMLQWKIKVYAGNGGATLDGYEITDDAILNLIYDNNQRNGNYISFNAFTNGESTNITDSVELVKAAGLNKVTIKLKDGAENVPISTVELFYMQSVEDNLNDAEAYASYQAGNPATVENSASGQMPGTGQTENVVGTGSGHKRVESSKVYQSVQSESVIGNADQNDRILAWKINLINDSGVGNGTQTMTDLLQSDGGGQHYIKPSQAAGFVITGKQTEAGTEEVIPSDAYTLRFYDASGNEIADFADSSTNAVKFSVSFLSGASGIRYVSISYQTTADVTGVTNGSTAHYNNSLTYEGEPKTVNGLTFVREDPYDVKNIRLYANKTWDDRNNYTGQRPSTYTVQVWRAEADANHQCPAADAEGVWEKVGDDHVINTADTGDQLLGEEFPQWVVKTEGGVERIVEYCYKIVEVLEDGSPYYVSSISDPVLAKYDNTLRLTNKQDADASKTAMNQNGDIISEIDLTDVPKKKLTISDVETDCYIFGWKVYFKEGATHYTDTLPSNAVFITGSESGLSAYAPTIISSTNWETVIQSYWLTANQTGNTLQIELIDTSFQIFKYYTAIPVSQLDAALQSGLLINTLQVDGEDKAYQAMLQVNKSASNDISHIEKGSLPVIVGGNAKYYLDVNPTEKKLSNGDYITITDDLTIDADSTNSNLNFVLDDITVYPYENGAVNTSAPIQDFSYTIEYDVVEETPLSVVQIDDHTWEILGWSYGDEVSVTLEQKEERNSSAKLFAVPDGVTLNYYYTQGAITQNFPAYENHLSTVSMVVPEYNNDYNRLKITKLYVLDNGDYTSIESVQSAKAVKRTAVRLNLNIPDQQHVRVVYNYRVTGYTPEVDGSGGDNIFLTNQASFEEDNGSGWDSEDHVKLVVTSSSASSGLIKYPKIYKVDVNDYSLNTLDAEFLVAKWNSDLNRWNYASAVGTKTTGSGEKTVRTFTFESGDAAAAYFETGSGDAHSAPAAAAKLIFSSDSSAGDQRIHEFELDSNTLYKFVEIKGPDNYKQPDTTKSLEENSDFIFYYAYDSYEGGIPAEAMDADGRSKVRRIVVNGTINIPNEKDISLSVQKLFNGRDEDIPDSADVSLKLYYSTARNGANLKPVTQEMLVDPTVSFANPVTLHYDKASASSPTADWTQLPSGMNGVPVYYFVKEESVTYGGTTYTLNAETGKLQSGDEECKFQPVYTRNGTNQDGTAIQVNNSEGILVRKSWVNVSGRTVQPPNDVGSSEPMSIMFDVYGVKDGYRAKLALTDAQCTLNSDNGYRLLLPGKVKLTGVTGAAIQAALEYSEDKEYDLSYFTTFEIEEKLTAQQVQELYGRFGNPQTTRMISNGTGVLEMINTDLRSDTVWVKASKIWDDNNQSHTGESIQVTLVQSTNASLTTEDLSTLADGGTIAKDYRIGSDILSTEKVCLVIQNEPKVFQFAKNVSSVTAKDEGWACTIQNGTEVALAAHGTGSTVLTVQFSDDTEQEIIVSVIEGYQAVLNESNHWQYQWDDLPAVSDSGSTYYYYVIEQSVPTGYEAFYSRSAASDGQSVQVTNILPTHLTLLKKWYDESGSEITNAEGYSALPDKIRVEVYQRLLTEEVSGTDPAETVTNPTNVDLPHETYSINTLASGTLYGTYDLEKTSGYQLVLKNLPKTNSLGVQYVYYVREAGTHVQDGSAYKLTEAAYKYIAGVQYEGNGRTSLADSSMTIRNTIRTAALNIRKIWSDGNDQHTDGSVTVRIHRETVADSASARQNPLILTLSKNEVTLYTGSTSSQNLTSSVPVKPVADDMIDVTLSGLHITLTPKSAGVTAGDRVLTFESEDGQQAELTVHIVDHPALTLSLNKYALTGGDAAPAVVHVMAFTDGTDVDVTDQAAYSSSNPAVISIDETTGVMTVNGVGTATITASYDGKTASRDVTVSLPDSFSITGADTVDTGGTADLDIDKPFGTFTWSSSDDAVATVDSNGVVTGVSGGTAVITAERHDGVTATKTVTVEENTILHGSVTVAINDSTWESASVPSEYSDKMIVRLEAFCKNSFNGVFPQNNDPNFYLKNNQNGDFTENSWTVDNNVAAKGYASGQTGVSLIGWHTPRSSELEKIVAYFSDGSTYTVNNSNYDSNSSGNGGGEGTIQCDRSDANNVFIRNLKKGDVIIITLSNGPADYTVPYADNFKIGCSASSGWNETQLSGTFDSSGVAEFEYTVPDDYLENDSLKLMMYYLGGVNLSDVVVSASYKTRTAPNTDSSTPASRLTRFSSASLRLSTAKKLAGEISSGLYAAASAVTPEEITSLDASGYFDKTISAGDSWEISVTDLPMYYVASDGTVESYYYWAEEIEGAAGYSASYSYTDADDSTHYSINASKGGDASVCIKNTLNESNEPVELPEAGGRGTANRYLFGGILLLSAAGYALCKRRRWYDE